MSKLEPIITFIKKNKLKTGVILFCFIFIIVFIVSFIMTRKKPITPGIIKEETYGSFSKEESSSFPLTIKVKDYGYQITPNKGEKALIYTKNKLSLKKRKKLSSSFKFIYTKKDENKLPAILDEGISIDEFTIRDSKLLILTISTDNKPRRIIFTPFVKNKQDEVRIRRDFSSLKDEDDLVVFGKRKVFDNLEFFVTGNKKESKKKGTSSKKTSSQDYSLYEGKIECILYGEEIIFKKGGKVLA
jgi:hypothetical protein